MKIIALIDQAQLIIEFPLGIRCSPDPTKKSEFLIHKFFNQSKVLRIHLFIILVKTI